MKNLFKFKWLLLSIILSIASINTMWAGTYTVVGVAMTNENNYYPRISVNVRNEGNTDDYWNWCFNGGKAGITFEGRKLYLAEWTDRYGGCMDLYFQQFSTGCEDEKNYNTVYSGSWTGVSSYNTKIWEYDESGSNSGSWYSALTMGQSKVYFDATDWEEDDIDLCIAHMNYQAYYGMDAVDGTKLYYTNESYSWPDAMGFGVVGGHNRTDEQDANGNYWITDVSNYSEEYTGFRHYALNNNGTNVAYLITNKGNAGEQPDIDYYESYTSLNHSQTVYKYTSTDNGSSYSAASINSGTITITPYKMTGNGTASNSSNTGTIDAAATTSVSKDAAYTGEVTLTASANAGYVFVGWFDVASGGSALSTETSYTYNAPNSTKSIYARFKNETTYTITIANSVNASTSSANVGATPVQITAPDIAGYSFSTWSAMPDGVTKTSGNLTDKSIYISATKAATVTANYSEDLTSPWTLKGGTNLTGDNWATEHALTKKTGHSTESVAYYTFNIKSTNTGISGSADAWSFKLINSSTWYGLTAGSDSYWWTSSTSANQALISSSEKNIQVCADALGEYEVKVDWSSGNKVTVTFPTAYAVTYGIGSVVGTSGSISATYSSVAFSSGTKVQSGKSVTLTAPAAKTGYTWYGWCTNSNGTGRVSTNATYSPTISATTTLYACYTENEYNVSVSVSPAAGGYLSPTPSDGKISVKQATGTSITANANTNYVFDDWTISGGGITPTSSSTSPQTFKATTTGGSIRANFSSQWTVAGSMYNTFDWSKNSNLLTDYETVSTKTYAYVTMSDLNPNTYYTLKVKDRSLNQDNGWYGIPSGSEDDIYYSDGDTYKSVTAASGNQNIVLHTAAAGDYIFKFNVTDKKLAIEYPTSYYITSGVKTVYDPNVSNTSDATETGGTYTAVDNSSNNVKGGKYVAAGASVTFEATPNAGYEFDGWYTNAACTEGKTTTNPLTVSSISANVTRYAKFVEIMTRVDVETYGRGTFKIDNGSAVSGTDGETVPFVQVGVHTTHKVTIVSENTGYYFAGWELSEGSSCKEAEKAVNFTISGTASSEDNRTNVTITGLGDPDKCTSLNFLHANFEPLEQIYFRNIFNDGTNPATHWSNVYVFFDVTWNDGSHCAVTSANNSSNSLHVQMEAIGTTNIYRAYIPRYATRNNKTNVAFADYDVSSNSAVFNPGSGTHHGSYRSDYSNLHNMFVPYHVKETYDGYWTQYYNKGYWMHYTITEGENAGYWIERHTGTNTYSGKPADQFVIVNRAFDENPKIQYRLRIDGTGDRDYAIFSEGGMKYKAASKITSAACDNVNLTMDNSSDAYFTINATAEGEYILTIDQSGDVMKLSVEYPIVAGDYILENAYNDGTAKTTHSNVIKSSAAGTKTRYSMFLSKGTSGTGTLKLRKCTAISNKGVPTWSTGDATNLDAILTAVGSTPGVYQFDITVADDKVSSVDSVRLYTGNFYLKTDAAPGGWVAYKNNAMDKNTLNFDRTSATFDNYWCHHYSSRDANIKCVIANDYCNQLSDTLKSDAIARVEAGEPYVPVDGTSIRFSYNSATNTIGRAYLGASSADDFLNIEANSTPANSVYKSDGSTNIYGASNANRKFKDLGNYVYEMDLKVIPGGCAGVKAVYTDASSTAHTQTLIPTTNVLLGGSSAESNKYDIRVVYDFKTNYLMTAFNLPNDEITDELADVDMLWIRHKDESPTQLQLGTGGSLSNVSVVAAIELRYNEMYYSYAGSGHVDLSSWTETSRPYLKYFVSFPFDVPVNSVFGLNQAELGREYVIQKYNGALRAKEGLFMGDGDNYWENLTKDSIMHANEGYCVIFDNDYARGMVGHIWDNKSAGSSVFLYFPASEKIASITNDNCTTKVASHECKVDRSWTSSTTGKTKTHQNTDSHWNMIGSPLFHDSYIADTTANADYLLSSYYELNYARNKWEAKAMKNAKMFKAMSSRLVQWYGTITWTTDAGSSTYAPRRTNETNNYFAKLEIAYNGQTSDWTYVDMKDGANDAFILREDMSKIYNNGIPQIYTFAGDYDVAYNGVPVKNQTIPVGLIIRKNGTYTFSMPTNFSGTVTLIDTFEQTRTNLAIGDYEVYLEKGTINDRFLLEFDINNAPTAIDGATNGEGTFKDGNAHKFIRNGMMYILHDGVVYDAQGRKAE